MLSLSGLEFTFPPGEPYIGPISNAARIGDLSHSSLPESPPPTVSELRLVRIQPSDKPVDST